MPRKKLPIKKTKIVRKKVVKEQQQNFLSKIKLSESYASLLLGVLAVVAITFLTFSLLGITRFIKNVKPLDKETSSTHTVLSLPEVTAIKTNSNLPEKYTVKAGDDLWSISEKIYKSGYNWVDIAKVNNISNPGLIFAGQELTIPNVEPIIPQDQAAVQKIGMSQAEGAIFGPTYTVAKDDNLWDISVRAYGDGYKYVDIIKANNLENPSLIFSGNILKIPRK